MVVTTIPRIDGVDAAYEAFATQEREWHAQRWRSRHHQPTDQDREHVERQIAEAWEQQLERRARTEAKRVAEICDRFPERAVQAARAADMAAPAIRQLVAWTQRGGNIAVLAGAVGCGKTTAAAWWALQQPYAPEFLRATAFAASSRYDRDARDRWERAPGLVLDDLGAEYADAKGSFRVDLDELVDVFYGDKRSLIITTNCSADEFRVRYGERVVDRLRECGTWLAVVGPSLRTRGDG